MGECGPGGVGRGKKGGGARGNGGETTRLLNRRIIHCITKTFRNSGSPSVGSMFPKDCGRAACPGSDVNGLYPSDPVTPPPGRDERSAYRWASPCCTILSLTRRLSHYCVDKSPIRGSVSAVCPVSRVFRNQCFSNCRPVSGIRFL